jgi:DNA-binding GntR family transcriptional regulator
LEGGVLLLRNTIYAAIRRAVLACEFAPGQELHEQILADRFHVSKSPVREALLRLALEGLVTVLPRQAYLVNAISIPDVEDMFDFRLVIAPDCAARAARADDTEVRALERLRADPHGWRDDETFIEYDAAFHCGVADICGSARLAAIEHGLVEQSGRLIRIGLRNSRNEPMPMVISEHNAIIDAIQAHEAETASGLVCQHLESGQARILAALHKTLEQEGRTCGELSHGESRVYGRQRQPQRNRRHG